MVLPFKSRVPKKLIRWTGAVWGGLVIGKRVKRGKRGRLTPKVEVRFRGFLYKGTRQGNQDSSEKIQSHESGRRKTW